MCQVQFGDRIGYFLSPFAKRTMPLPLALSLYLAAPAMRGDTARSSGTIGQTNSRLTKQDFSTYRYGYGYHPQSFGGACLFQRRLASFVKSFDVLTFTSGEQDSPSLQYDGS